jgi:hypothetical protein
MLPMPCVRFWGLMRKMCGGYVFAYSMRTMGVTFAFLYTLT